MYLAAFIGSCFLIAMIPGVSTAIILRQTLRAGPSRGAAAMLGNETGVLLWALAAVFGLSALLTASEVAYEAIRIGGAAVLVWLGARSLWQSRRGGPGPGPAAPEAAPVPGAWRSYLLGLGTALANPKAAVFALSFLPQFVPAGAGVPATLMALALIWVAVDTVWYLAVIWLLARVRAVFERPRVRRALERISGVVLIGLGLRVVTDTR
ncbi:threonine transporter RhtB [Sphaerisporangium siamense]|uniref:Threonine/homoserine/homoserine lactone efflux protein n=1 Tax=Sphaerisporangium siamense TaxID=795645 RepID=A0A7W7DBM7_9ACTN|nr:LysE family translocator [Sphaerisporangium siamense]MBB4703621.1 threonine/homoserine/homoserine lactone efflux protein [Sphaerisporangium siamense]GII82094.1 threonine transporter RhtB [Sphaerisporangium siamense]